MISVFFFGIAPMNRSSIGRFVSLLLYVVEVKEEEDNNYWNNGIVVVGFFPQIDNPPCHDSENDDHSSLLDSSLYLLVLDSCIRNISYFFT